MIQAANDQGEKIHAYYICIDRVVSTTTGTFDKNAVKKGYEKVTNLLNLILQI